MRTIIHTVAEKGLVHDEKDLFAKLMQRENIQSTAVGNGFAIPHCFDDEIPDLIIIVARSFAGLEFGSFDGKPTRVVFLLIGSSQAVRPAFEGARGDRPAHQEKGIP